MLLLDLMVLTVSADWPSFRGPNGSGLAPADAKPPVSWSTSKNVRWKVDLPGLSHSSPVVSEGRVYVLTAVAQRGESRVDLSTSDRVEFAKDTVPHIWRLIAIDEKSGRVLWNRAVHEATPRQARHAKSSYANATPSVAGRYIAAILGGEAVVTVDRDGNVLWKKDLGIADPRTALDLASSPVIFENLVIVQCDTGENGYLAAFDLHSGAQVWKVQRNEGYSWSTPAVVPGGELVVNSPGWVRAYDARTGRETWRVDNRVKQPGSRVPVPVVAGDKVIISGGGANGRFFAVKHGQSGEVKPEWSVPRAFPSMPSPIEYEGLVYSIADNGVLRVYKSSDGSVLYEQRVTAARISASPVAASGRIYVLDEDGDAYVIKGGNRYELLGKNSLGELCMATPAVVRSGLLIRTNSRLYAVGR